MKGLDLISYKYFLGWIEERVDFFIWDKVWYCQQIVGDEDLSSGVTHDRLVHLHYTYHSTVIIQSPMIDPEIITKIDNCN